MDRFFHFNKFIKIITKFSPIVEVWSNFIFLCLCVGICFLALNWVNKKFSEDRVWAQARFLVMYSSVGLLIAYALSVAIYTFSPVFLDHAEPNIIVVSWLFAKGQPIYHELESAARYSHMYGPMLYIINAWLLRAFGPSIFSAKLGGAFAGIGGMCFAYLAFCIVSEHRRAIIYAGIMSGFLLIFDECVSYWPRADSFILFFVSMGLTCSLYRVHTLASVLCGLALGIVVNLKIHSISYFLPVLVLLYQRHGLRYVLLSIFISALVVSAPFVHPSISFGGMLFWLQAASRHGLSFSNFIVNIKWLLFISTPVLLYGTYLGFSDYTRLKSILINNKLLAFSSGLGILATIIVASKPGAGEHHLIPFIPLTMCLFAHLRSQGDSYRLPSGRIRLTFLAFTVIFALSLIIASSSATGRIIGQIIRKQSIAASLIADLNSIMVSNPNKRISMGFGRYETYHMTFYRTNLVFEGNPYLVDPPAMMDMQLAGIDIPSQTINALQSGFIDIWLIPKGDDPFTLRSYYNKKFIFDDRFRKSFLDSYRLADQSRFFDLLHFKAKENGTHF